MNVFAPANNAPRLSVKEYINLCSTHFKQYWKHYTLPIFVMLLLQSVIRIDVNYTDSLPNYAFITVKGWKSGLGRGDYVAYRFPSENPASPFRKGDHMVKIIGAVGGDQVRIKADRSVEIIHSDMNKEYAATLGGQNLGTAKPLSKKGFPLEAGPQGTIPEGSYYVFAPHKDSLDSRYAMVGWIKEEHIIGRTFPLF